MTRIEELTRDNPLPDINANIADFYILKGEKAKADEVYGKDFMEGKVNRFAFDLVGYANFWLANNDNQESAVAMAETALKLQPENTYILQQVAAAYVKTGKDEKALAIFGPEYIKSKSGDANSLYGYARFWTMQGKNLDDALQAAKKAAEIRPGVFYVWSTLSDVQLKLKNYPEALKSAEKAYELAEENAKKGIQAKIDKIKKEQGEEKK